MANISPTFSGDFSSFMVGKIFDIISDAKSERAKADKEAAKYGVDVNFTPGEFTARSARNSLIESTLGRRFVPQTKYPDLLARGQFSSDPLMGTPTNVRKLPEYQQLANPQERLFNNSSYITGKNVPSSGSRGTTSTTGDKPVKVKDEKLGVYLAGVIKALNANIASINERLDDTEQGVIEAKEGVFGTIKQLEQNSDLLETKLDSIIDALREQNALAKVQEDTSEVQRREDETEKEFDLSDTERIIKPDEKKDETIQLSLLDDIKRSQEERDEQLSLPLVGGDEGFEKGGIVSGPDSGYFAKLHGDEMIIPLDNNYTQGEPSAIDGRIARRPKGIQSFEKGTKNVEDVQTPMNMGVNIFNKAASVEGELPDIKKDVEKLSEAMLFPIRSTGILISHLTQDALGELGSVAGDVGQQIGQVAKAFGSKFDIPISISNSLVRQKKADKKTEERQKETKEFKTKSTKTKDWWDPFGVFTGEGGGGRRYGTGGPGGPTLLQRLTPSWMRQPQGLATGTRGVRAGFTGMNAQGFNAMMQGQNYIPSSKPQILGQGAYSAPTYRGAQRYAGATGSLGGRQLPGGVVNSIVPGNAPRINFLEPQAKVSPQMFNKGRDLATKLQGGAYPNSSRANMLRAQIRTGGVSAPKTSLSAKSFLNPIQLLFDLVVNELQNPAGTSAYDQVTGPNAMYNDPSLSEDMRRKLYESVHGPGSAGQGAAMLNQASQEQAVNRFARHTITPNPIIINNQTTAEDSSSDVPQSHIANMGDTGFSTLYPSLR